MNFFCFSHLISNNASISHIVIIIVLEHFATCIQQQELQAAFQTSLRERERERERDGQRFIDMSFQSTVYPSEEMYLCTVGGISICCKISRNNTAWSPQYCTVFSLADLFALFLSHTCTHKKQSCQQDPSPFISIPLNLTNMKHLI